MFTSNLNAPMNAHQLISLSNSFQNWIAESKRKKLSQSNLLLSRFSEAHQKERDKLPHNLNLLDDLKTNENAHSKFLIRLLEHRPTLIHFLSFLNNTPGTAFYFDTAAIKKPKLTAEKMRIDGLIREQGKYAVIIENKIHGAVEQEHQVARYIDKCKSIGFSSEQIYVLYLTRKQEDVVSAQTWGTNYRTEDFHSRYLKLAYESEILPWLQQYLETLPPQEIFIQSAVIQYIDHLNSLFRKKRKYAAMNKELRHFLSAELNLGNDLTENIEVLDEKLNEINELTKQLNDLLRISKEEAFEEWKNKLKKRFEPEETQLFNIKDYSFLKTGITFTYRETKFSVLIEYNIKNRSIYYGFGKHYASEELKPEIAEFLAPIINREGLAEDVWWYGWQHTSFNEGYLRLEDLIDKTLIQMHSSQSLAV